MYMRNGDWNIDHRCRDSGNDFGRFSVSFFEGRISYIWAACKYPTRNVNFQSRISDIGFVSSFSNFMSHLVVLNENDQYATQSRENESLFHYLCIDGGQKMLSLGGPKKITDTFLT